MIKEYNQHHIDRNFSEMVTRVTVDLKEISSLSEREIKIGIKHVDHPLRTTFEYETVHKNVCCITLRNGASFVLDNNYSEVQKDWMSCYPSEPWKPRSTVANADHVPDQPFCALTDDFE